MKNKILMSENKTILAYFVLLAFTRMRLKNGNCC
jgi:hypothetical protein